MMYNGQRTDMMVKPHTQYYWISDAHTTAKGNIYNIDSYWTYSYLPGQLLTIGGNRTAESRFLLHRMKCNIN